MCLLLQACEDRSFLAEPCVPRALEASKEGPCTKRGCFLLRNGCMSCRSCCRASPACRADNSLPRYTVAITTYCTVETAFGHEPLKQARSLHALRDSALRRETTASLAAPAGERASHATPINLCQGRQKLSRPTFEAALGHEPLKQARSLHALKESALCRETAGCPAAAAAERASLAVPITLCRGIQK